MNGGDPAGGKAAGAATGVPHAVLAIDAAAGCAPAAGGAGAAAGSCARATPATPTPSNAAISTVGRDCVLITRNTLVYWIYDEEGDEMAWTAILGRPVSRVLFSRPGGSIKQDPPDWCLGSYWSRRPAVTSAPTGRYASWPPSRYTSTSPSWRLPRINSSDNGSST